MTPESSRKTDTGLSLAPAGCPRCGTRLGEPYKYCPNCAYRLRPDLFPAPHLPATETPLSQRVVALGGYLLFASMLLLVVFTGVRLFARPEPPDHVQPQKMRARDLGCLALTLDEFVEVPAGPAFWGPYDPGREYDLEGGAEAAAGEREAAERAMDALATVASESAKPKEIAEALKVLAREIRPYASALDATRRWVEASRIAVPQEPVDGTPEAYHVDDSFRMSRREITNDQYFEFLRAWARKSGRPVLSHLIPGGWKRATGSRDVPKIYSPDQGDVPVVNIPFDAALEFCGWFWEERLGADPNLVVDLPTWKEYILAARGDHLEYNFPWGRTLWQGEDGRAALVNLDAGAPLSVVGREEGAFYNGFLDLVGNAAEWVYRNDGIVVAAGWSYEDKWVYQVSRGESGQPARLSTPFSSAGFHSVGERQGLRSVGFRPVIRRAPALPSFVPVTAGTVRHRPCPESILPPERLDLEESDDSAGSERETIEQIRERREPLVTFAAETERVERDFDISATEVTNRQYLAFLAAIAPRHTKDDLALLVPRGWQRENLLRRYEEGKGEEDGPPLPRAFDGYYVPWERLATLYAPGQENLPVQGVTIEQVNEYMAWLSGRLGHRCSIPTVAQYLRAARGDGTSPYPWGDDRRDIELTPSTRPEPYSRPFSLPTSRGRPVVGLAGNVAELVRDPGSGDRLLLAGGFYDLPPRLVTLDCFLDANWDTVQYLMRPGDWDWLEDETQLSVSFTLREYIGFRVVRLPPF